MIPGYAIRPGFGLGSRFGPYITGGLGLAVVVLIGDGYVLRVVIEYDVARVAVQKAPERVGRLGDSPTPVVVTDATRLILGSFPAMREVFVTVDRTARAVDTNRTLRIVDAGRVARALGHDRRIRG